MKNHKIYGVDETSLTLTEEAKKFYERHQSGSDKIIITEETNGTFSVYVSSLNKKNIVCTLQDEESINFFFEQMAYDEPAVSNESEHICTLEAFGDYRIDIVKSCKHTFPTYEAWLYEKNCGIKDMMFGCDPNRTTLKAFIYMVKRNADEYICNYIEDHLSCEDDYED